MGTPASGIWAKRVESWKDSGLTAKEFAAEGGLNHGTLMYWASRLRKANGAKPRRAAAPRRRPGVRFVELQPSGTGLIPMMQVSIGRYEIKVSPDFDAAALKRLLEVVEARL